MSSFVLCDPALVMPPPDEIQDAALFWARLVEWSEDRRLRLGPAGYELVLRLIGSVGWPMQRPDKYPPGMAQLAHQTLSRMLAQVVPSELLAVVPRLSPSYVAHPEGEPAISADLVALHQRGLLALATARDHWSEEVSEVSVDPPPPTCVSLLFAPGTQCPGEIDGCVARYLETRRITIVGGVPSNRVRQDLLDRFKPSDLRWLSSDPGTRMNLDALDGLQARIDIVYCVTGHIGHDGSTKAQKCCRRRGIEMRKVAGANDIAQDLCRRHGVKST